MSEQRPNEQLENIEELQKWQDHVLTNKGEEILSQVLAGQLLQEIPSAYIGYMPDLETLDIEQYPKYLSKITELPTIHKQIDIIGKSVNKNETLITVQITNSDLEETFKYNAIILMCKTKTGSIVPYTISGRKIPAFLSKQNVPMRSQFQLATLISTDAHITVTVGKIIDADTVDFDNEGSNLTSTNVQSAIKEVNYKIKAHIDKQIASEEGSHGIRYFNETLQVFKEDNWINVGSGGTGGESGGTGTVVMSPVTNISVKSGDGKLVVSWNDPEDNIWSGTKLVYKIGSYPQNYQDGTLVVDNQEKNKYSTNGIEVNALTNDTKYYFMFFPYDSEQRYSFNVNNKAVGTPRGYRVMTLKIDLNNSNSETCCTYHDDAIGMTPGSEEWDEFFGHYPCLLKGLTEVGKLKRDDFTKFEDGTDADITTGESGNVMICFPLRLIDIRTENNITTIKITDNLNHNDFDGAESKPFSYNNKLYKKIYYGVYKASLDSSNKLVSLSNKNIKFQVSSHSDVRKAVKLNGDTYNLSTFYAFSYIQLLFLFKYKTLDSTPFLNNLTDTTSTYIGKTGGTEKKGMDFISENNKYKIHSKMFGIEDLVGNMYCFIEGISWVGGARPNRYFKLNTNQFDNDSSYVTSSNFSTTEISRGFISKVSGNNSGFLLPTSPLDGSSSTFFKTEFTPDLLEESRVLIDLSGSIWGLILLNFRPGSSNFQNTSYRIMAHVEEVTE